MRTFADSDRAPAPSAPGNDRQPSSGSTAGAVPLALDRRRLLQLQAQAGNRATVAALRRGPVVQRAVDSGQAATIAARLHDAMEGLGTDEEAVYGALTSRTPEDVDAIREAYLLAYDHTLLEDVNDDFSGDELARVLRLLEGTAAPGPRATPDESAAAGRSSARAVAEQLRDAMEGLGTAETQIFNVLEGRTPDELSTVPREYASLTGRSLERDLADDLSGDDLARAMRLLGVEGSGTFENTFEQNMTEGVTTVGHGLFDWALTPHEMRVEAPVKFVPDAGVSPPYTTWNSQIASTWNRFAVREPGGQSIPLNLYLRSDPGCDRTLAIHNNTTANWWEDRADAGNWYLQMTPDTAPHEFGHYIGLEDEYQRTHGDITRVTGAAPAAGITNESGRTADQIAADVHAALTGEPRAERAARVTTALTNVGLISADGVPQQGDFAQEVQTAYNDAHTPTLVEAMRDNLDEEGRWTIQTVFSFATRTVMGNPEALSAGRVANQPHDHGVLPRHLTAFARLVRGVWPDKDWEIGPR
jgi:hypothetical protein